MALNSEPEALATLLQQAQWLTVVTLDDTEEAITVELVSRTRQADISGLQVRVQDETLG